MTSPEKRALATGGWLVACLALAAVATIIVVGLKVPAGGVFYLASAASGLVGLGAAACVD